MQGDLADHIQNKEVWNTLTLMSKRGLPEQKVQYNKNKIKDSKYKLISMDVSFFPRNIYELPVSSTPKRAYVKEAEY